MENTLLVNDRVLVNKLTDKPDEIHRGDIVVFRRPRRLARPAPASRRRRRRRARRAVRDALVFVGLAPAAGEEDLIKRVIGVGGDHVVAATATGVSSQRCAAGPRAYIFPGDEPDRADFDVTVPEGEPLGHGRPPVGLRGLPGPPGAARQGLRAGRRRDRARLHVVWPLDRASVLRAPDTFDAAERLTAPSRGARPVVGVGSMTRRRGSSSAGRAGSTPTSGPCAGPGSPPSPAPTRPAAAPVPARWSSPRWCCPRASAGQVPGPGRLQAAHRRRRASGCTPRWCAGRWPGRVVVIPPARSTGIGLHVLQRRGHAAGAGRPRARARRTC